MGGCRLVIIDSAIHPSSNFLPFRDGQAEDVTCVYFSAWAAAYRIPTLIVTMDMRIVWSNLSAEAMLEEGDCFTVHKGYLACPDKDQEEPFRAFLADLSGEPTAWIHRLPEQAFRLVRAERVTPAGQPPGVSLMVYPTDARARYVWGDISRAFGLTRAEAIIVRKIIDGDGAAAVAEDLSVSLETVRTHIRRVYNKLGINSREQLFSTMSGFRIGQ